MNSNLITYYQEHIVLVKEKIIYLCCNTIEQSSCTEWFLQRLIRLSASSNIYCIYVRKTKSIESLIKDFLNKKNKKINLHNKKSVNKNGKIDPLKYGLENESKAFEVYKKTHGVKVIKVGVMVSHTQSWLCASFDGVVMKDNSAHKLLEIKCPFTCSEIPIIDFSDPTKPKSNVSYLHFESNKIYLKSNDKINFQIQTQLYVSGLDECDLLV